MRSLPVRGKNLLVVNYSMNFENQVFAHQPQIVEELSKYFSNVGVITSESRISVSDKNIRIQNNWNNPSNRIIKIINLLRVFIKELLVLKPKVVFFHMTDVHAAVLAPVARIFGLRVVLWYAHTHRSKYLILSRPFVNLYISSTTGSFPLKTRSVKFIGQSIKSSMFPFAIRDKYKIENFIHIGRLDSSKNIPLLVSAITNYRVLEDSATLTLVGSVLSKRHETRNLISRSTLGDLEFLRFTGPIPRDALAKTMMQYDCFIHAFDGSLDKSIIEATFTGIPVVTSNPEYLKEFGSWCQHNPHCQFSLVSELIHLSDLTDEKIRQIVIARSNLARSMHEFDEWIKKIVSILTEC